MTRPYVRRYCTTRWRTLRTRSPRWAANSAPGLPRWWRETRCWTPSGEIGTATWPGRAQDNALSDWPSHPGGAEPQAPRHRLGLRCHSRPARQRRPRPHRGLWTTVPLPVKSALARRAPPGLSVNGRQWLFCTLRGGDLSARPCAPDSQRRAAPRLYRAERGFSLPLPGKQRLGDDRYL